ncbi:hypothetical protein M9458_043141, partial [Cirrhinus mrigala]
TMLRVEQTLTSYLSPDTASSLKAPVLLSKLLCTTSELVGKGYSAPGQAGACLHTMAVLQPYQVDLLKELDECDKIKKDDITELRRAADLPRTTYLGVEWDSTTMQAHLSPAQIESILTAVARVKEGRSLTVKQFQQLLGLTAAASNLIPFGLLYTRPLHSPVLDGPSMVLGPDFPSRRLSMGDSLQEGSPLSGGGHHPPPSPGVVEAVEVWPSTRKLDALKHRQQDPVNCPVGTVLEFLQDRFSAGLAHSTLKVYVAAISAYHASLGGSSVGRNPLVTHFLRGALRLRPLVRPWVPPWDLAVVLEALCRPPFEHIEESSDHHLTIKTALLLELTSLKRVGDLQALSVAPSHLDFAPGMAKAFLYPRPGYVPKVHSSAPRPVVLQAFCPPPFREPDQQKLNCMCSVRALDTYVHGAA